MKVFYSREGNHPTAKGWTYRNPRYFVAEGVIPEAKEVLVAGDFPNIVAGYKAANVPVEQFAEAAVPPAGLNPTAAVIPPGWRDMPFEDLALIAKGITHDPVRSKADARRVIEKELAAREAGKHTKPAATAAGQMSALEAVNHEQEGRTDAG
jgi:hypothetical protein